MKSRNENGNMYSMMRLLRTAVGTLSLLSVVGVSIASAQQTKVEKPQKKKKTAPFQWVNPPNEKERELVGVSHQTFESPSLKQSVGYFVYLPSAYEEKPEQRFPVVYYLHGGRPGSERKSIKLASEIHRHIDDGAVPPMIYVFVNGGPVSHYNMPDDPSAQGADVFIKELIPHVDQNYRTIAARGGRGLEGFSQGGRGTARLMFRHHDLFCSAAPGGGGHATEKKISENDGAESDTLRFAPGDNTWDLARVYAKDLSKTKTPQDIRILVHVGDKGFNYENNLEWMQHLKSLGIEYESVVVPGATHSAREIYEKNGLQIMRFHAENFGLPLDLHVH